MFKPFRQSAEQTRQQLANSGYWPARAAEHLDNGRYSQAVEICQANLSEQPELVSGRLILARALLKAGHPEAAARQFSQVLSRDADNLVALKFLGDIRFAEGDYSGAIALYERILEIDPECRGIKSTLERRPSETTRTITLKLKQERSTAKTTTATSSRIPFYTETIGDLYLQQGHARLAAEVYAALAGRNPSPRIADKLAKAEQRITEKDH